MSLDPTKRGYILCYVSQHCVSLVYWSSIYLPWGFQNTGKFLLHMFSKHGILFFVGRGWGRGGNEKALGKTLYLLVAQLGSVMYIRL